MATAPSESCPPAIRLVGDQPNEGTVQMIVIGADTHKDSHVLAAVDDATGKARGSCQVKAEEHLFGVGVAHHGVAVL